MVSRQESDSGSATTGYLILSGLSVIILALFYKDPLYLVFAIPLVLVFTLAASADKTGRGSVDEDLEAVGWSDKGMEIAVPLGIIGGMAALFIGSIITKYTADTASILVPDFTGASSLSTASVIPPYLSLSVNILSQWLVVSSSEESMARVLAPFAFLKIFKNIFIAYILASAFWILMHIPTYLAQGANQGMYLVLLLLAFVTTLLYIFTKNLMSSIIAHSTFNTGVLLSSNNFDAGTMYVVTLIIAILLYAWISGALKSGQVKI
ncbi:MAG: CPBP family intramembrane metalloprotease [Candidatus Ratteibacteria bacterium]|nr:CPBP family intramembrane metalloprotease [Candidatus Ratteibacteria bacterium]